MTTCPSCGDPVATNRVCDGCREAVGIVHWVKRREAQTLAEIRAHPAYRAAMARLKDAERIGREPNSYKMAAE